MKELSIEEKAKRYDEAIERAKGMYEEGMMPERIEYIFPELKESEDERIRKALISILKSDFEKDTTIFDISVGEIIAWLEKQGRLMKALQISNARIGELIEKNYCLKEQFEKRGTSYTKKDIDDAYLKGVTDTKNEIEKQYEANYQIRKDIATFIFNYKGDIKDRAKWIDYLGIKVSFVEKQGEQKPNPCDSCVNRKGCINCENGELRETEQKAAWSEEDKVKDNWELIHEFVDKFGRIPKDEDELNVLVEYVLKRQNPAWSEEDENILNRTLLYLENMKDSCATACVPYINGCIIWLKSLRPQNTWKPSEEQMEALYLAAMRGDEPKYTFLVKLYNDLKKLSDK